MKKRILSTILVCALVCGAAACDGGKPASTTAKATTAAATTDAAATEAGGNDTATVSDASAEDITAAVLEATPINSAFAQNEAMLENNFDGLDVSTVKDYSYYVCASGAYPDEVAVFRFSSEDAAGSAVPAVSDRLEYQKKTYKDYTPDEYYKLEGAIIGQSGEWLYYIVTSDNSKAESIVKGFIG